MNDPNRGWIFHNDRFGGDDDNHPRNDNRNLRNVNRNNNNNNRDEDDRVADDLRDLAIGAGVAIGVAGAAYGLYKMFSGNNSKNEKAVEIQPANRPFSTISNICDALTIASSIPRCVDAAKMIKSHFEQSTSDHFEESTSVEDQTNYSSIPQLSVATNSKTSIVNPDNRREYMDAIQKIKSHFEQSTSDHFDDDDDYDDYDGYDDQTNDSSIPRLSVATNSKTCIVNPDNRREYMDAIQKIKSDSEENKVLGFECEWVRLGNCRQKIALLQLATYRGHCALFRLSQLKEIPSELAEILRDRDILKVSINPHTDARYLFEDYYSEDAASWKSQSDYIRGTLDVRFVALMAGCKPASLAKMSNTFLGVSLDDNLSTSYSDWNADPLSSEQISYAEKKVRADIDLFKCFAGKIGSKNGWRMKKVIEQCSTYADEDYERRSKGEKLKKK